MLTETERRGNYARQAGAEPDTWTGTGPQRRRLAHKAGHARHAEPRAIAAYADRYARAQAADQQHTAELLGQRFPLRPSVLRQAATRLALRKPTVTAG